MYNRLYKHLSNLKILYPKQFDFQNCHSADLVLLQIVDKIYQHFERSEYTIDLSKAFDHNILQKKIENLQHI